MLEATKFHNKNHKFNKISAVSKNVVPIMVSAIPQRKKNNTSENSKIANFSPLRSRGLVVRRPNYQSQGHVYKITKA